MMTEEIKLVEEFADDGIRVINGVEVKLNTDYAKMPSGLFAGVARLKRADSLSEKERVGFYFDNADLLLDTYERFFRFVFGDKYAEIVGDISRLTFEEILSIRRAVDEK